MYRPRLTKFPSSSPSAKAFNQLARAVSGQANIRPGPGMGINTGPFGRLISLNATNVMTAYSMQDIPASVDDSESGERTPGQGVVYRTYMARQNDGTYRVKTDTSQKVEVVNLSKSPVATNKHLMLIKIDNIWQVFWEDCG